jgi:hypothetical protein
MRHFLFQLKFYLSMLSATTNASKSAQICPKVPKSARICPKTISLRTFEIPPKFNILIFFRKNNFCM